MVKRATQTRHRDRFLAGPQKVRFAVTSTVD